MERASLPKLAKLAALKNSAVQVMVIRASVALAAILALYLQDLAIVFNDAINSEATSHVLIIPVLIAYLIYRKRRMLNVVALGGQHDARNRSSRYLSTIAGSLLCTVAIMIYWYGSYTFTPLEYHVLTLPLFASGLILALFNPQTLKEVAFPVIFLAFLIPPPSEVVYGIGSTLSVLSSQASNAIANLFGIPTVLSESYGNPTIIVTRPDSTTISFSVDVACSGIYSIIGFLIFALFLAYIVRDKLWKRILTFLAGFPLIYLLNIVRITLIILIGYYIGEETALNVFHLLGGWVLILLGTLLLLIVSEKLLKTRIFTKPSEECKECNAKAVSSPPFCSTCGTVLHPRPTKLSKSDVAKILVIVLATVMLVSIQAPVFAITQARPAIMTTTPSGQQVSTNILPQIPGYTLSFLYRDTQFEAEAKQDLSLMYEYESADSSKLSVWVALEMSSTRSSLHRWEYCLITYATIEGYQPRAKQIELTDIQLIENPPIISRYFAFQHTSGEGLQVVLYWYESSVFTMNSTSQRIHVKISLIAFPSSIEELPAVKEQLVPMGTSIAEYWEPVKTWSQITMIISQNGPSLAAGASLAIVALPMFYEVEKRKTRRENKKVYERLSAHNKQIITIIKEEKNKTVLSLNRIEGELEKRSTSPIDPKELAKDLANLETTRVIQRSIINVQDRPVQVWKAQIAPD